ncbi:ATP-binding protein [Paenibacillus doosanensis]|uniref:histidine kinase n=1 Tax=Paenibacillus konkukensis TaxID=2020716 RepID=A0ABY4RQL9_9BACL|nr:MULTISPECIES: ATP-binding protein [Paenibacillus]MCS7459564.1 ATP-binding protein [Paenibacillus doosanensis]UQZ84777.1 Alkaline phosphatase synthesis sensor protein PhoR [Paenibacillus konkukensis]
MKLLRIISGIAGFLAFSIFVWTLAFLITTYAYNVKDTEARWNDMLEGGRTIAALQGANEASTELLMKQLALLKHERLVLIDGSGRRLVFGGEAAEAFAAGIDSEDVEQVRSGADVKKFEHPHLLGPGLTTTGQAVTVGGRQYALFIQQETDSLFHDYGKQLVTVVVHLLIFFLLLLCTTPMRKKQMHMFRRMIALIRRIGKGDFSVTFDITKDRHGPWGELAESLNHMTLELNQMEQMRQEFISNVSHEIQSPLTSIGGFARALHNDNLSAEERRHYLDIIETESRRLSKLSDNLLKLTSLESRHHPFDPKPFRLDKQLRRLVLACEPQWLDKGIEMDVSLDEITIVADEDMMSQVWVNLLGNSIKFTPAGGTIGVQAGQEGPNAVIRISDTGIGISEEEQEHVFERFYKADKSRSRAAGGSGLGLSIVKNIVERHHGSIRVQSRLGEGTCFIVTLPLKPQQDKA